MPVSIGALFLRGWSLLPSPILPSTHDELTRKRIAVRRPRGAEYCVPKVDDLFHHCLAFARAFHQVTNTTPPHRRPPMKLLDNWRDVLTGAWSMKLMGFAAFLDLAENVVPLLGDIIPWWATVALLVVSMVARLVKQPAVASAVTPAVEGAKDATS